MIIFYIILVILVADFCMERILDYLNSSCWSEQLPKELEGIYNEEKYRRSQHYFKDKQKVQLVTGTLTFLAMTSILVTGGIGWLDVLVHRFTMNPVLMALIFFGILGLVSSILSIPFEWYRVFIVEQRYGFNTMTPLTFILDILKGWLLGALIGGGLVSLIVWIWDTTGNTFWLITWGVISGFQIFLLLFYSNIIVPLFNKQKPLEEGYLRNAIQSFAAKTGFRLKDIYVMDGSKRSTKANAYFTGLGSKKRIVLYDTLVAKHSVGEIVAVLAHEIGHYKKRHTLQSLILSLLQTGLMLFILSLFIQKNSALSLAVCQALTGFSGIEIKQSFHLGILAFGILYGPLSLILGLCMNKLSRRNEYAADRFSGLNNDPRALQDALKKLSVDSLSNLKPHPLYVFFYHSHPPLLKRLSALTDLSCTLSSKPLQS